MEGAKEWDSRSHDVVTAVILSFEMRRLRLTEIKKRLPGSHRW